MSDKTRTSLGPDGETVLSLRQYEIQVTGPDGHVKTHRFKSRLVTLGTSPDCDLALDDRAVSRHHCQIEVDDRGYRLRDLGSKNGTHFAGLRITDVYLEPDTRFAIGDHDLLFGLGGETVEIHLSGREVFGALAGRSLPMREVFAMLARVAPTDATVLIEGESGTGKELAARAVHDHSKRKAGPFVVFDCSTVPKDLLESELFGHVRGAFTGAHNTRKGAFEQASGGTLFLDELGELSLELQPKLLRALDSGQIRRVGATDVVQCDTRIVAATNRDLKREVEAGNFREDLFYRVAVIHVSLPPLRRRPDDIPLLVERFLDELSESTGKAGLQVSFSTMEKLKRHRWPGNVRELRNFVERATVLADGDRVETRFLRVGRAVETGGVQVEQPETATPEFRIDEDLPFKDAKNRLVEAFEKAYWKRLLERTGGNVSRAARIAGVHRKSVEYILKKLDLSREDLAFDADDKP